MGILTKLLVFPKYRELVGRLRLFYFVKLRGKLKSIDSTDGLPATVKHNMRGLKGFAGVRMDKIIKPLSVIETLNSDSKLLVIGPRNEGDLLCLMGHGFKKKGLRGLDLITYSPLIEIGDMHEMKYEDNSWDAVICGWTISYSKAPEKFAQEAIRVVKNSGVIAIGVEYSDMNYEDSVKLLGYELETKDQKRVNSVAQILALFEGHVDEVFFNHDAPAKISHSLKGLNPKVSSVVAIFSIKK